MTGEGPAPGFPDPLSHLLAVIVRGSLESFENGDLDCEGTVLQAAVQAWFEGHIEGEECLGFHASSGSADTENLRRLGAK
jgi:hypothetical protein